MKTRTLTAATVFIPLAFLTGCAINSEPSWPNDTRPIVRDFGCLPNDSIDEKIKMETNARLKDPYSAKYMFTHAYIKTYTDSKRRGLSNWSGYSAVYYVNAKNSYGGYTGDSMWTALVKDGVVCQVLSQAELFGDPTTIHLVR